MPTTTHGTFFLRRRGAEARPGVSAEDFRLTLRVLDRHKHGAEGYVVTWRGAAAANWWAEHGARLVDGQPLDLELMQPRSMPMPGGAPEIHAAIARCQLAPTAPSWQRRDLAHTPSQPCPQRA